MQKSELTGNKYILYKISETGTPPTSTMSFKKPGSRPVSLLAHPVHPQEPSMGHYQDDQAATTKKRSQVQSVLYSTLEHMPVSCGAADHREAQIRPRSSIFQWPDANRQDHTCFFLKRFAQEFQFHEQDEAGLLTKTNGQIEPASGLFQSSPNTI